MTGRYDLHLHSRRSYDSFSTPRGIVAAALRRGLSGIAVTDHGTIAGGLDVLALAPPGLLVIVGAEIYTTAGDIVGLFLRENLRGTDALDIIAQIHAQGGLAFLPHPLRSHPSPIPPAVLEAVDGYEVLNGRAGWFDPETAATGGTDWRLLSGKAVLGNSDGHFTSEIGGSCTIITGPATAENVQAAIRERRTAPSGTPGPASLFYRSQLVKLIKTRDVSMVYRLGRRLARRLF